MFGWNGRGNLGRGKPCVVKKTAGLVNRATSWDTLVLGARCPPVRFGSMNFARIGFSLTGGHRAWSACPWRRPSSSCDTSSSCDAWTRRNLGRGKPWTRETLDGTGGNLGRQSLGPVAHGVGDTGSGLCSIRTVRCAQHLKFFNAGNERFSGCENFSAEKTSDAEPWTGGGGLGPGALWRPRRRCSAAPAGAPRLETTLPKPWDGGGRDGKPWEAGPPRSGL